jgi:hypothetical protein
MLWTDSGGGIEVCPSLPLAGRYPNHGDALALTLASHGIPGGL